MKKLFAGIDIGGTNTAFGLVDERGAILAQDRVQTASYVDPESFCRALAECIGPLIRRVGNGAELAGIGIGAPNAKSFSGAIEHAPNLPWKGVVPLVGLFKKEFPLIPVVITNDAKAAALGEKRYGAAREMDDFLVVTLGTGVGSGFFVGGKLLLGHDGTAGELGHVGVDPAGRGCGCGRRGCLETYASATGIRRTVFQLLAERTEPSEFRGIAYDALTAERITQAALTGDPIALQAYEFTGERLGRALADAALITQPEAIFLLGGLARAGELIFEPTRRYMKQYLLENFRGKIKLLPSGLSAGDAAILGAAAVVDENV